MSAEVLLHFSEDPTIEVFHPVDGRVWAITQAAQSLYWFPRDSPRAVWWPDCRWDERLYAIASATRWPPPTTPTCECFGRP